MLNNSSKAYFVEKITQFLPNEQANNIHALLRPEFVQDE
jgi:hypothetical protein